jgi:hypothetical protein
LWEEAEQSEAEKVLCGRWKTQHEDTERRVSSPKTKDFDKKQTKINSTAYDGLKLSVVCGGEWQLVFSKMTYEAQGSPKEAKSCDREIFDL